MAGDPLMCGRRKPRDILGVRGQKEELRTMRTSAA
jgi:hypothetical protein